ncbi:ABC transporter permease [Cyclobacterium plantarum]|uniref:FtsX-like permease family protein n=1 Tax=Cyclobacterium plantarum TaxID=2716263 RepID=A0ABX0HD38_9BACT|nr:ABC transporter permease [Cyclobacterium plantarum]NHE57890.1 FtsX-like permease family protein [Cyclobacterium plantarum]
MLKNYFKIAFRYLWQTKISALIHIGGLAVAMAAAVLILLWSQNELRFDTYNPGADRIYLRADVDTIKSEYAFNGFSSYPIYEAIQQAIPEIEQITTAGTDLSRKVVEINGLSFKESNGLIVGKDWIDMFDYKVYQGSLDYFFNHPRTVILTRSKSAQYFGDLPPLQQTLYIDSIPYSIAAIIEDIPANSSFQQDVLVSNSIYKETKEGIENTASWGMYTQLLFLKLHRGASLEEAEQKIAEIIAGNRPPWMADSPRRTKLVALKDLHFETGLLDQIIPHGNTLNLWVFSILAVLLLAVGSVNFVNLSIARIGSRIKEIGIRKTVGASKHHLFIQAMVETFLSITMASGLTLLLVFLVLPEFNAFVERNLVLNLMDLDVLLLILGVVALVFIMTGLYPAMVLATLKPVSLLKSQVLTGISRQHFRKWLVTGQLIFTMVMLIGIVTVHHQFAFIQQQTDHYQKDQVFRLHVPLPLGFGFGDVEAKERHRSRVNSIKASLLANNAIQNVSQVNGTSILDDKRKQPVEIFWSGYAKPTAPTEAVIIWADEEYAALANLTLVSGRWFEAENTADINNLVINETAVKNFALQEPVVGTSFTTRSYRTGSEETGRIIGVIKDYHHKSLHEQIDPIVFSLDPYGASSYLVKVNAGAAPQALDHAKRVWNEFTPEHPFGYTFLDEEFDRLYKDDRKALTLSLVFGGLSILLSSLGLLGMISVSIQQRTKEIGIRKVMGANVTGIMALLSRDLMKLILISFAIASPIAWYGMNRWLENFAYRINMNWWIFAGAAVITVLITVLTVSSQTLRAALKNPVESLRTE